MSDDTIIKLLFVGFLAFALFAIICMRRALDAREMYVKALTRFDERQTVDPWELQAHLMSISEQRMPKTPTLHNGVVLYGLLNAEELGETLCALSDALAHHPCVERANVRAIAVHLHGMGKHLQAKSKGLRMLLEAIEPFSHPMTPHDARELFDGTTDLAVTNSGFALSAGFPGSAGYAEVANSNISKKNPATGVIDKTPDGKWIKGVNFRKPDLMGVLALHCPAWAARNHRD